jgi:hypothetical protein
VEVALEALGKSIARWAVEGGRIVTAISALPLSRRDAPTQPIIEGFFEQRIKYPEDSPRLQEEWGGQGI